MCTLNPDLTSGQRLMVESRHMGVEVKVAADKLDRLEAENEKLKKLLAQYGLFQEIVGDPATEFASLRRELHRIERENIKLRTENDALNGFLGDVAERCGTDACPSLIDYVKQLRELVRDMWRDGMCECDEYGSCAECEYHYHDRMHELGIEV